MSPHFHQLSYPVPTVVFLSPSQPTQIWSTHVFLFSIMAAFSEGRSPSILQFEQIKTDPQTCNTTLSAPGVLKGNKPAKSILLGRNF